MTIHGAASAEASLYDDVARAYDAVLVVSFGGPEGPDDVLPFLENVTRGRAVPRERLLAVAEHYQHFGGVSPINEQNRALVAALRRELASHPPALPVYLGNRNWHPYLADTIRQMRDDGVRRALALVTSAFGCYSGCRQYREDVIRALEAAGPGAPEVDKLRLFFNHTGFIEANAANLKEALDRFPPDRRGVVRVVFTAHSIPMAMAHASGYEPQLLEASRLVAEAAGAPSWDLIYQSRSGPPHVPWLEPDVCAHLEALASQGVREVVIHPIGFLSDHMEVRYDLDTESRTKAEELGLTLVRARTVGTAPGFVAMLRELIQERMVERPERPALGCLGPSHDICPIDCCLPGTVIPSAARNDRTSTSSRVPRSPFTP
ncbi:MAG TPA: ferrochelatase [Gemmatimonadales bacterium]|nr:ferrochelatase [Gemmatimonadales bacterium]